MNGLSRFGIVDMGSNAIRMMVVEATPGGEATTVENHRLAVRLGREVFNTGLIPEEDMAAAVDAFRRFMTTCERLQVRHVRAIATAAMREARNRDILIDRIREATGVEVAVISGTQEAYLLGLAVQSKVDLSQGRSLLIDVGGGSVEVMLVDRNQVISAESYRLGALRMLQALSVNASNGESFAELLRRHLRSLEKRIVDRFDGKIDRCVATGGNIESLADLLRQRFGEKRQGTVEYLKLSELRSEVEELTMLSFHERVEKKGLKSDRADTIVPAGIVYVRLCEIAGIDVLLVPRTGIKDGLVQEVIHGHLADFAAEDHVDTVLSSCRAMGRKYHFEGDHAESVMQLGRQLFDQLQELHGLDGRARVLLDAGCLLHDVGVSVNNSGHHKHSHYLIRATELVGLSEDERAIVAMLARHHRKAPPSREHEEFQVLKRKDRLMVERLVAILRVADALDRQHNGAIRDVQVSVAADGVDIRPALAAGQASSLTLEKRAVAEKGTWFGQVFGKPPRLV